MFINSIFLKKKYSILILFSIFYLNACIIGNSIKFPSLGPEREAELAEHIIEGVDKDKILILSIDGVISENPSSGNIFGGGGSESTVSAIINDLFKASFDRDIKGIILKVNSPGGTVTGSDLIYRELMKHKATTGVPIIALFMDKAASGGYYVAMSADKIVSLPTAVTGSVGVILSGFNVKEGQNKAIGSPFLEMKPEQKAILQSIVNNLYERFFNIVKMNRQNVSDARLREICDGRIFTADQALKEGMIDKIGYFEETVAELMKMDKYARIATPNNSRPRIVYYSHFKQKVRSVYQILAEESNTFGALESILKTTTEVKFMYLWSY